MIISASRRTDIPAFYSQWFFNRIKDGYVYVRNPMNVHQISQVDLSPDVVDGIVLWTKNPIPMLSRLEELNSYVYYFQFTLTAYDRDVEPNIPSKNKLIIPAFQSLSTQIGKERLIWRYDPIFFNERYTLDYHTKYFRVLASKLAGYTEKCTISFIDMYRNTISNTRPLNIQIETHEQQIELAERLSEIAHEYGIYIDTCAEGIDLKEYGVSHACCIDKNRFERLGNYTLEIGKDPNQRKECGCIASIDIGAYNTCRHGCRYCYANYSKKTVDKNSGLHNPDSPLLFGEVGEDDVIKERKVKACRDCQMSLFNL